MGEISSESKQQKLKKYEHLRIRPDDIIEEEQTCLSIVEGLDIEKPICSLGDFSMIIGKAKSKKTFAISIAISACITNSLVQDKIKAILPIDKLNVLYFDTEQSGYHFLKCVKRICKLSNLDNPENLYAITLRAFTPNERLLIIKEIINSVPNVGFVVIDGIRDLVSSINDEEQSTMIASWLLKTTKDLGIHIMVVLHENKADTNARGHLGTELVNKAETVLSVTKDSTDKDISNVESKFSRNIECNDFAFKINDEGLPLIIDNYIKKEAGKQKRKVTAGEVSEEMHKKMLKSIFEKNSKLKYGELCRCIKNCLLEYIYESSDGKSKDFLTHYLKKDWVIKRGISGTPNAYYEMKTD